MTIFGAHISKTVHIRTKSDFFQSTDFFILMKINPEIKVFMGKMVDFRNWFGIAKNLRFF